MMKRIYVLALASMFTFTGCNELQSVVNQIPDVIGEGSTGLTDDYIGSGLKEALNKGITEQVSKLTATDGFLKNDLVKILLPEELQKVDTTLRKVGLSSLADEGLKIINRAAEDAVGEATPIFVNAIKEMSFTDAKNILLGDEGAATQYLNTKTNKSLYGKFSPVISNSLEKVGANKIWSNIINKYNAIPLFNNTVNPDLTDYVTQQSLTGVYTMIGVEEKKIRTNVSSRTSDVLRKVFALQDK